MAEHSIMLSNRQSMEITGVKNVITFDETEIILDTTMGFIYVMGEQLHISMLNLDEGKVTVEGMVSNIEYRAEGKDVKTRGKNILNRLLK